MELTDQTEVIVKVLFFAKARELTETGECPVSVGSSITADRLKEAIFRQFPVLVPLSGNVILAVNQEYCSDGAALLQLKSGDEVAIIPPLSGG